MQKKSNVMKQFKVIKTEKDYRTTLAKLEKIFNAVEDSAANEAELLMILIQDFERKNYPVDAPTPVEAIKFRMEQLNLRQADLVKYIGSHSRVSEILNGKRSLTLNMIITLHKGLSIPLESLILNKPTAVKKKYAYSASANRSSIAREKKVDYSKKKK